MAQKVYIVGLKAGARQPPAEVTQRVWDALNALDVAITPVKTTRAGCVVVEADEQLERLVNQRYPALFIEEQKYLRRL